MNALEEKEAVEAVQIENVVEGSGHDPAEMEPRMNLQTCLAFLVCTQVHLNSLFVLHTDPSQAIASQYNAYVLTLLIPSTTLGYINAELGPDPNYSWITVSWVCASSFPIHGLPNFL